MRNIIVLTAVFMVVGCTPVVPQSAPSSTSSEESRAALTLEIWNGIEQEYLSVMQSQGNDAAVAFMQPVMTRSAQAPTATFAYENESIAFDIPYNPVWGSDDYRLPPYWEEQQPTRSTFGPLYGMEGGIGRDCWFSMRDPRSLEQAMEESGPTCDVHASRCEYQDSILERKTIGVHEVLITSEGSFDTTHAEIAGKEKNYEFWCWDSSLEEILKSVRIK